MRLKRLFRFSSLFFVLVLVSACQPVSNSQTAGAFSNERLTPYFTATVTPTATATPANAPTATSQPTQTPTPQIYVLKGNETLWTIAAKSGLTLKEILAANPDVNPYSLTAGMKIVVPASSAASAAPTGPTATALPVILYEPYCTPSLTGGLYCFASTENNQNVTVQNLMVQFILTDTTSGETRLQSALLPLDHLTVGSSLPLFAYFSPPVSSSTRVQVQLLTAYPDSTTDSKYLALTVASTQTDISADGLSAKVAGSVSAAADASRFWIVAVAYDAEGKVVAVRQFDKKTTLAAGTGADYSLYLYSIGGKITHVAVFGEVTP